LPLFLLLVDVPPLRADELTLQYANIFPLTYIQRNLAESLNKVVEGATQNRMKAE